MLEAALAKTLAPEDALESWDLDLVDNFNDGLLPGVKVTETLDVTLRVPSSS